MTDESESLFKYDDGLGHADFSNNTFVPKFLDEVDKEVVANATTVCKNNTQCIFDLVFTDNRELAEATIDTVHSNAETQNNTGIVNLEVYFITLKFSI